MTDQELKSIIIEQILKIAPDVEEDDIEMDAHIQRSLEIDSFDFLKILTAMNEKVGVSVPEADYAKVDTLTHMIEYFQARI